MDKRFETTNEVIIEWIETKLRDACRCIGLFTNYLLVPRDGFMKHSRPTIPLPVVKYVIEEVLGCGIVSKKIGAVTFPEDFYLKCRKYLKESIKGDVIIGSEVIEYLWKYISLGVSSLTEDINVDKEVDTIKSRKQRELIKNKKEALKKFKEKSGENDKEIEEYAIKKIRSYKNLKKKITDAISTSNSHISKYESDPTYRTYKVVMSLSPEEEELLLELKVKPKRVSRMKYYSDYENDRNKALNDNTVELSDYTLEMKELLIHQISTLDRILAEINSSTIASYMKSISEDAWEKEYVDLEKKSHIKKFMEELNRSLNSKYADIENDDTIKDVVQKRMSNKIKTKIGSFQSYISQRSISNNKFYREIDGCILQSMIYLIVTLTDWLEVDYVTSTEILYALRILLPSELSSYISSGGGTSDEKFKAEFIKELEKYNLKIKSEDYNKLDTISGTMGKIDTLNPISESYEKFNNRVRYFANTL